MHTTADGGTLLSNVRLRAHAASKNSRDVLMAIVVAALDAIRGDITERYAAQGDDVIDDVKPGPMGWTLDAVVSVEHSWDRTTYEAS